MPPSLPYTPPHANTLLILASFLLSLNVLNHIFDRVISCGLIAQILLGVAFGTPGGDVLGDSVEEAVVALGYIGLVLLVFEGGLSTSFPSLRANLALSTTVALTGISLPIALSYVLLRLTDATPLQAFAAGAALCSTSLGTTFTVLGTSGLVKTRMGVVLATAAMLDDVVGLVMVQVIGNLAGEEFSAVTVVRPVLVSLGFVVLVVGMAWVGRWVTRQVNAWREGRVQRRKGESVRGGDGVEKMLRTEGFAFIMHTGLLVGMVAGAAYAGTSDLFAAYLAGALISWWDSEVPHFDRLGGPQLATAIPPTQVVADDTTEKPAIQNDTSSHASSPDLTEHSKSNGLHIFETYYQPALQRILKPFFFASIGFSIPITQMFQGNIVWRWIVYSVLMFIAKLACGMWLVRISGVLPVSWRMSLLSIRRREQKERKAADVGGTTDERHENGVGDRDGNSQSKSGVMGEGLESDTGGYVVVDGDRLSVSSQQNKTEDQSGGALSRGTKDQTSDHSTSNNTQSSSQNHNKTVPSNSYGNINLNNASSSAEPSAGKLPSLKSPTELSPSGKDTNIHPHSSPTKNPISLYPAFIVGAAMTARGEIGFLISSTAQSNGTFATSSASSTSDDESSPIFLVVTWAIMLCTIVGPIIVGALVKRVKKLERMARSVVGGREKDVLGVWGVE